DAIALVHAHIAKEPVAPHNLDSKIPEPLSQTIMKLLEKRAENRYQSAYGLKMDLEGFLLQLQETSSIEPVTLGEYDTSNKFQIPQKLYGREDEHSILLNIFEKTSEGQTQLILVTGPSGIGKSALIHEIHKPLVARRGYFISGKFDQLKQDIPYFSLIQAFQNLIRQILTEDTTQVGVWRQALLTALGPNGQLMIDVIPDLTLIIGDQPPVQFLPPTEAQNRFNFVFQNFVRVFAQPNHPLVIFLDDLQWADAGSLNLIQRLATDPDTTHLLFIGAYRDNEVGSAHPLSLALENIEQSNQTLHFISLPSLTQKHIIDLIGDTLHCSVEKATPLAELILKKTRGNPFFVREFLKSLYDDELVVFDFKIPGWEWDIANIKRLNITDNVIELITQKLTKLSPQAQQVIQLAACIGTNFDLHTLTIIYQKSQSETAADLWETLEEEFIFPIDDGYKFIQDNYQGEEGYRSPRPVAYKFLHDRIQQAAYALISDKDKKAVHLKIGRLLLQNIPDLEQEDRIFEVINQFNLAPVLITDPDEKETLARLNLIAGQRAKASTAYGPALSYLQAGLLHLPDNSWQHHYNLTLDLYLNTAEVQYLTGDFQDTNKLFEIISNNVTNKLDQAALYNKQLVLYTNQNRYQEAISVGIEA
ncbi:MAG: AAA family ATPase, partial [Chloroflexota bacterium]